MTSTEVIPLGKKGYLIKKGHFVKNWKRRLFVLDSGSNTDLYYYKDDTKENLKRPQGSIPLFKSILKDVPNKNKFYFQIDTIKGKTFMIEADSQSDKDAWMSEIKKAIDAALPLSSLQSPDWPNNEKKSNKIIEKQIKDEIVSKKREVKLLLLGPGESGKSTFAKQMKLIHLNGFEPNELISYKTIVYHNVLEGIQSLVLGARRLGIGILKDNEELAAFYAGINPLKENMKPEWGESIKLLWKDPGIQKAFKRKDAFQCPDSCLYCMENVERISSVDYVPTPMDVIQTRVKSTGIYEIQFNVNGVNFRLVDVGGQRSERKKWIHCFEEVTSVLFFVALSEYNMQLFEDEKVNRMHETIELFDDVCNDKWLRKTPMIVFFNKSDLFREKIKEVDLKVCFPDYNDGPDYHKAIEYIKYKFLSLSTVATKSIYCHVTIATDTSNIRFVFQAVQSIILEKILSSVDLF